MGKRSPGRAWGGEAGSCWGGSQDGVQQGPTCPSGCTGGGGQPESRDPPAVGRGFLHKFHMWSRAHVKPLTAERAPNGKFPPQCPQHWGWAAQAGGGSGDPGPPVGWAGPQQRPRQHTECSHGIPHRHWWAHCQLRGKGGRRHGSRPDPDFRVLVENTLHMQRGRAGGGPHRAEMTDQPESEPAVLPATHEPARTSEKGGGGDGTGGEGDGEGRGGRPSLVCKEAAECPPWPGGKAGTWGVRP